MFYELIRKKRNLWLQSTDCTVRPMLQYIEQRGMIRDAQTEAIKTYLFLKIACKGQPLYKLFSEGYFNDTNIGTEELTVETRNVLETDKAALALFQYARLKDKNGKQLAPELEKFIRHHATEIDYEKTLCDIFYGVTYADYLFSLPMGAGKTFLMAAFIYIDLYFAQNEPDNPVWAHNFLVLAPSALKSSIIPSLRSIREFDPSWIFSEVEAKKLKQLIQFEILDEQKSANKSNTVKNPNAQKINNHLMGGDAMGIVAITNAEKVILDRLDDSDKTQSLYTKEEWKKIEVANELRNVIRNMPHLSVFIDEVHHATDGDIKLRQVVTQWATQSKGFCNVLGFSGTPYLEKAEKTTIGGDFVVKNTNISNVVYYYPLIDGIDNFLKRPTVKYADSTTEEIVRNGVREFLDKYKDTVYADGTHAKLAIYCGQIPTLEDTVFPLVSEIVTEYALNPAEVILKRHKGNKQYPEPEGSEVAFANLSSPLSRVRIVLLAQIGKEGWDCKSLTGVILPHEGACPKNMVLQTSCRCMRQVVRGQQESSLIWMNKQNADKLNKELKQQQNITLKDFTEAKSPVKHINRYSRMERQQVPPIDFYQFHVVYETVEVETQPDTAARLADAALLRKQDKSLVTIQDLDGKNRSYDELKLDNVDSHTFRWWVHEIARESFGTLSVAKLMEHETQLRKIFEATHSDEYDHQYIRSMIRKAFVPKRDFKVIEEIVPEKASILSVEHLKAIDVTDDSGIYPKEADVQQILDWDEHPEKGEIPADKLQMIEQMRNTPGVTEQMIEMFIKGIKTEVASDPHPERLQTYHYLPYRFDSNLELGYFTDALQGIMRERKLEYYFNGDDTLTDFKIKCYRKEGNHWQYDGLYVPDFLVVSRKDDGSLDRICIIETKGEGYAAKFKERREFMEKVFVPCNNEKYGTERFSFLYLEDTDTPEARVQKTIIKINQFFK